MQEKVNKFEPFIHATVLNFIFLYMEFSVLLGTLFNYCNIFVFILSLVKIVYRNLKSCTFECSNSVVSNLSYKPFY
jgi:hypothetical protein